jgi:phosphoribosylanthranilate isomerase
VTWAKICGVTNLEDAQVAVDAGADAVGFVFYEKSPRNVGVDTAQEIIESLPVSMEKVGVFVSPTPQIGEIARRVGLTAIQLHMTPPAISSDGAVAKARQELIAHGIGLAFGDVRVYLALPAAIFVNGTTQWNSSRRGLPGIHAIFLDSSTPQQPGGTGKTFDWTRASPTVSTLAEQTKVVIAGGLTFANVGDAIRILKPWGVDVASGVERQPGKKDPEKVRAFVKAVREADKSA